MTTILLILLVLSGIPAVSAQETGETEKFFPKYQQWVTGEFYQMYKSVDDPQRIFGDPFTREFDDTTRPGFRIQYFERARMDYDPSKPAGERVTLAKLGEYARPANDPGVPMEFSTSSMCQSFPNGKQVCFAFLDLYSRYAKYLGQPITNAENIDGQIVQYFEKARMEWRNEMPKGSKVVLTPLGPSDFDQRVGDVRYKEPDNRRNIPQSRPLEMRAYAFTAKPLVSSRQQQEIDVLVNDQNGSPLAGANVSITVVYPGNQETSVESNGPTDTLGFTRGRFTVQDVPPNSVVQIKVTASRSGLPDQTTITWFRVWW